MKDFLQLSRLIEAVRSRMQLENNSRSPLQILRIELQPLEHSLCCEWLLREADAWDAKPGTAGTERRRSEQALRDAIRMRALIFQKMPSVETAELRVYRPISDGGYELMMTGDARRDDTVPERVASLAMRAMLYGFHFVQEDGVLCGIPSEAPAVVAPMEQQDKEEGRRAGMSPSAAA